MIKGQILAALLMAAVSAGPAVARDAAPAAATASSTVQLDHISITAVGSGPAVILIPGLATPRAVWDDVVPVLARTHRVLTVQVNGFGDEARGNDKPGLLAGIADDLARYVADRGIARSAIIGHSMGGLVAMMIATRHPEAAGRVLVVDSLPFFGLLFGSGVTVDTLRPQAEQAREATRATPPVATPITSDPGGIWSNTAAGRIQVANWSAKADPKVTAQALYEVMTTDLRPELRKVTAKPFTILYATGAGPQAKAIWEHGYADAPVALVPIADSWHFIMLDQPAAFAKALDDFLRAK